jgi:hypothetical protein
MTLRSDLSEMTVSWIWNVVLIFRKFACFNLMRMFEGLTTCILYFIDLLGGNGYKVKLWQEVKPGSYNAKV